MATTEEAEEAALQRIAGAAAGGQQSLDLAGLGLVSLPEALRGLTALRELDLSGNRLTSLPEWLGELTRLRELDLRGNGLVVLPESMAELRELTRIDLAGNLLIEIPPWVGGLNLAALELDGNPHLFVPPPKTVAQGTDSVLAYLRRLQPAAPSRRRFAALRPRSAAVAAAGDPQDAPRARVAPVTGRHLVFSAVGALAVCAVVVLAAAGNHAAAPVRKGAPRAGSSLNALTLPRALSQSTTTAGAASTAAAGASATSGTPTPSAAPTQSASGAAVPAASATVVHAAHTSAAAKPPVSHTTTAAAAPPPSGPVQVSKPSATGPVYGFDGLCLDDQYSDNNDYATVDVYSCNGTGAQQWSWSQSDSTLQVLGKCLDVAGGQSADGTKIDVFDCNGTGAQVFVPRSDGSLYNPQSGKCLDDPDFSSTPGTALQIWDCNGGSNQQWALP